MTGGTGFVGRWLLESFVWANEKLGLNAAIGVLTRNPERFKKKAGSLASNRAVHLYKGDIRSFSFPKGKFEFVIHAATENESDSDPLDVYEANVEGTRRMLDFASSHGTRKFLFTSSGAVYGKQPENLLRIQENYAGAPRATEIHSAYGQSKRISEFYCAHYARKYDMEIKIARCFTFLGPFLPLNINYAIGNFIRDAIAGDPIEVKTDHRVFRSYLYSADLAIWLWTILFEGRSCCPYNTGSAESVTVLNVAKQVARACGPQARIRMMSKTRSSRVERYVPDVRLARKELGLRQTIDLQEGIRRMVHFYSSKKPKV